MRVLCETPVRLLAVQGAALAAIWLLSAPLFAKAPTVLVTVAGGGLRSSIEITDPQVLKLSNAWGSEFIDNSRHPEDHAPQQLPTYEVSFYAELRKNDVRKMCVLYYCPQSSEGQGFVYLPGSGVLRSLNAGTMMRGQDGKWSYASPAWESAMKPFILRKEGERQVDKGPEVWVDGWTKPQSGWLYVLDPRSESDHPGSRVWLFDPNTGRVMGSVHAGFEPDFALSPDGSRLYVASGERERGELAVIDTSDGKIRNIAFPERILYHPWYFGLPPFYGIAVSADGGALGIPERRVVSPEKVGFQARIFLTGSSRFLRETIGLDNCEHARLVPSWTADEIVFLCPAASTLRSFRLGAESGVATGAVVPIPHENGCDLVGGFFQPDGRTLALVRTDGAIYQLDMGTQRVRPTTVTGTCQESRVFPMVWPRSPDGSKFYLGYGGLAPNGMSSASELRSFDTATWQPLGIFRTSVPFWSAVTSGDGRVIYALAPEQHSVLVLDAATGRQMRTISVGQTPALALVVP